VRRPVCWEEIGRKEDLYLMPSCETSMMGGDRELGGFLPTPILRDQYSERR